MTCFPRRFYGLIDCNSFFASCEKLFRPDLKHKPVVVLSNNDGVVVARSPEAKELGIPMGEPYFKIKHLAESGHAVVFSSNYRLYGDLSNRVMQILRQWTPNIEVYSIDESFLEFTGIDIEQDSVDSFMQEIVTTVKKWTGIPVSLGLAPTMTLAKVANDLAKKKTGICSLLDPDIRLLALADMEIGNVWGIGRRLAPKMLRLGIRSAKDLAMIEPLWIRKHFTIVQEKLVRELNGECCLDMATVSSPRKNIQVSRSFPEATNDYRTLAEAVSTFAAKACEKARSEGTAASAVYVHLNTSRHNNQITYVSEGKMRGLSVPSSHTPEIIRTALEVLQELYREELLYKKVMVMLLDLQNANTIRSQGLLFEMDGKRPQERDREDRLMLSLDKINRIFGKGTLFFGSQGVDQQWRSAAEHCSPNYTLHYSDLPIAKAK